MDSKCTAPWSAWRLVASYIRGSILVRQRNQVQAWTERGHWCSDDTLFATVSGIVKFRDRGRRGRFISVYPQAADRVTKSWIEVPGYADRSRQNLC